jgi:ribosomal protein S6--L-glutamate ligase
MRILILSKEPDSLGTRRLFKSAVARGHHVEIANYAECYITVDKGAPTVKYEGRDLGDFDAVIPRIAQSLTKYGSSIVRQFEMMGVYTACKSIALVRARDKLRSLQILAKNGVDIPKTVFARETADFEEVIDLAGGAPVIIKVARGTHGNGVVLAETRKAAKAVMQAFYVESVNFLVQEYIAESAGSDIRAFVIGNQVVASMQRQSLDGDFRSNIHQGAVGTPVRLTDDEKKIALKAAKAIGLNICGVDIMRSARGPLVLEVNASPGFTIEKVTGRKVSEDVIKYIEQNAKQKNRKDKVGA